MKGYTKTCLLLEDDPDDKFFFKQTLQSVSAKTVCLDVSNGEEALTVLREGIRPDFIFTDLDMPRMNGMEFIQKLKNTPEFCHIPVVVYSGSYSPRNIRRTQLLGAAAFYSKADFQALPQILDTYFGPSSTQTVL